VTAPWQVAVIAKSPEPGAVKTRLCPPLTHDQAAELALAALLDTLDAVRASGAHRCVLVLSGRPGRWLPSWVEVVGQRGGEFGARLQGAVDDTMGRCGHPVLVVGMDTPQVTPEQLARAGAALAFADTVLGLAEDGEYWIIGTRSPVPLMLSGVPMSTDHTGRAQLARLRQLGLTCARVAPLRDVDRIDDAFAVARQAPGSRFAITLAAFGVLDATTAEAGFRG
jgi:uncharacterized protein